MASVLGEEEEGEEEEDELVGAAEEEEEEELVGAAEEEEEELGPAAEPLASSLISVHACPTKRDNEDKTPPNKPRIPHRGLLE